MRAENRPALERHPMLGQFLRERGLQRDQGIGRRAHPGPGDVIAREMTDAIQRQQHFRCVNLAQDGV